VQQRPSLRIVVAVGLVAGSVLALQVLLTRLLSAVVFYHFGFLAISLALLGAGTGAILIYVRPGWFVAGDLRPALARWSVVLSLLLVAVPAVIVRLDYDYAGAIGARFVLNLGLACLLATLPFAAAGIVIALAIRGYSPSGRSRSCRCSGSWTHPRCSWRSASWPRSPRSCSHQRRLRAGRAWRRPA
jgi:uncharacterized membrane protein YhdT